jgi:hypothetical protein
MPLHHTLPRGLIIVSEAQTFMPFGVAAPKRIGVQDLVVEGRYLHVNGLFVRQIDGIDGDSVMYHDQYGQGQCGRRVFLKQCPVMASKNDEARGERELLSHPPLPAEGEFTLRDEANALTAYAFRHGFLEELHAGKSSPLLEQPGFSRISDEEMQKLMIDASAKLTEMLRLKREKPVEYGMFIRRYQRNYCRKWKRD